MSDVAQGVRRAAMLKDSLRFAQNFQVASELINET